MLAIFIFVLLQKFSSPLLLDGPDDILSGVVGAHYITFNLLLLNVVNI